VLNHEEGNHADNGEYNPGKGDNEETVSSAQSSALFFSSSKPFAYKSYDIAYQSGEKKGIRVSLFVVEGDEIGQQQEIAFHQQEYAEDAFFHLFSS